LKYYYSLLERVIKFPQFAMVIKSGARKNRRENCSQQKRTSEKELGKKAGVKKHMKERFVSLLL
jgi:hypothetical protein